MTESILNSTKKVLGLGEDYDVYDQDIMLHINSAISTLTQLGVGDQNGYMIAGEAETWEEFIGTDPKLNPVKSYIYLKVRMVFDPPDRSDVMDAFQRMAEEMEVRLNWTVETPKPVSTIEYGEVVEEVLDGGGPSD